MKKSQEAQPEQKPFIFYAEKTVQRPAGGKKVVNITRRTTYAGILRPDGTIDIGMSMCSEKDQFTKRKGTAIAVGRACKKPVSMLKLTGDAKPVAQFINQVKKLITE